MAYLYPFDPVGNLPSNLIIGEQHVLTPANNVQYHFIVPVNGPFFSDSLEVRRTVGGVTTLLQLRTDYLHVYPFIGASRACAKPVYGGIGFTTASLSGIITIKYQTIGGEWVLDEQKLLEVASNTLYNPRMTSWESIVGLPNLFPPVDHDWNLVDMVGEAEVLEGLYSIEQAILQAGQSDFNYHTTNLNNPHHVTKAQVGLGSVPNFAMGDLADVTAGTMTKFASPGLIKAYVDNALEGINLEKASSAEIIVGTDNDKYTTPAAVKTALNSILGNYQPKLTDGNMQPIAAGESVQRYLRNQAGDILPGNTRVQEGLYKEDGATPLPAWSSMQLALRDQNDARIPFNGRVQTVPVGQTSIASPDSGNLIQSRSNGLYYGISAPPSTAVLYVDAVNGDDSNIGNTSIAPLKTLKAALVKGLEGTERTIRLKEGQTHALSENGNDLKAGKITIYPYGTGFDSLDSYMNLKEWHPDCLLLNTIIDQSEGVDYAWSNGTYTKFGRAISLATNCELLIRGIKLKVGVVTSNPNGYPIETNHNRMFLPNESKNYLLSFENCDFIGTPPNGYFKVTEVQPGNSGTIRLYGCQWSAPKGTIYSNSDVTWKLFLWYNSNTTFLFDNWGRTGGDYLSVTKIKGLIPIPTKEANPIVNMKTNIPSSTW